MKHFFAIPTFGKSTMFTQALFVKITMRAYRSLFVGLFLFGILPQLRVAAEETLGFNKDVRPILAEYCYACHGADSASRKADLRLDQREAAIDFGALVPGEPDSSEILTRVLTEDPDTVMPPPETKKALSDEEKETLRRWIAEGAHYEPHWSFIAPERPVPPSVNAGTWVKNDIDRFVLARLEAEGLTPAPEADPFRLFRRLHLDITGLPPEPTQTLEFVSQYQSDPESALSNWIDRLMQSNAWGEHRARYWLDAARYGDTHGMHFDNYREMYPYRDWVIRAFNRNQPFDQFTVEQLAGDLLDNPSEDQLIATGFQRCNITTNEGGTIEEENLALYAADRVQTFGWVFLGLTTNCSQCHDHKFDPISMKDYYSLAAFFRNTTQGAMDGNSKDGRGPVIMVPSMEDKPRWEALPGLIDEAIAARQARREVARGDFEQWLATAEKDSLDADIRAEGLLFKAAMNEGSGQQIHAEVVASSEAGVSLESKVIEASGPLDWVAGGTLGAAVVLKAGSTFEIGDVGNFRRDEAFGFGAWIRPQNDNQFGAIFAKMDQDADFRGWDFWQQGRNIGVHIIDKWPDNALKVVSRDAVLVTGKWQHVFATYDGSGKPEGVKLYVNGKSIPVRTESNTLSPTADIQSVTPLRIGQRSKDQFFEGGSVQDLRIYSGLLEPSEVSAIAEVAPIGALLALAPDARTQEQVDAAFEYFLNARDAEYARLASNVSQLESEREAIRSRSPVTHIQQERANSQPMAYVLMRGEYDRKGDEVLAAPPAALHAMPAGAPRNRLGLAQWVVDPANPLTSRVTVNRFWQQVFGRGLVVTAEDFGITGALPTHPELLDWLAVDFRESGWDVKRLFKTIFMSATYRQSAEATPEKLEKDRDNALVSRGPRFRMDAEMVRDLALASSQLLSSKMYGPSVKPYQPIAIWDQVGLPGGDTRNYVQSQGVDLYRRTLYTFWKRMAPPPSLEAFNAPSREVCTVRRERTNTPLQALVTLNDPQYVEAARVLAQRAIAESNGDDQGMLDWIGFRVLGRPLNDQEVEFVLNDKEFYLDYYKSKPDDAKALSSVGEFPVEGGVDYPVLAAWTMVCNQIMNLDEALTK